MVTFQSTLPRGERRKRSPRRQGYHHFNPRSREGSDPTAVFLLHFPSISIHAPARGATDDLLAFLGQDQDFNPRSREGSDLFLDQTPFYVVTFQSTLPRGERRKRSPRRQGYHHFNPRSREGSDQYGSHGHNSWQWISIHAPARGATCQALLFKISFQFQSTLPRGERRREKER